MQHTTQPPIATQDRRFFLGGGIKPYDDNPRTHPPQQITQLTTLIKRYGFHESHAIAVDEDGVIIWGHGRQEAAIAAGLTSVPVEVLTGLTEEDKRALRIADNGIAEQSDWDMESLQRELDALQDAGYQLELLALDDDLLDELGAAYAGDFGEGDGEIGDGAGDEIPDEEDVETRAKRGDVWQLGRHRVMCGDSTDAGDVARLMDGAVASLLHADPPYGMGKEKDGVENDNLYAEKLDSFQMQWWKTFRPFLADNGSAYIWGNAEDLWRLWYCGGLKDSERLTFRNEIVWGKGDAGAGGISHQGAAGLRLYPNSTERCLFFMLGEQGFNTNADNYWEGWEPIRSYLADEVEKMGGKKWAEKITGTQMGSHWFTKSQWCMPTRENYEAMQNAAKDYGAFKKDYDELKKDYYATRAYFDNTHENMIDVWEFSRVTGEDRHGHATPKPVDVIARAVKSSSREGDNVIEPFLGSGTTLIAAEKTGRTCYGMEISPGYVDVILKRWEDFTGGTAEIVGSL